MNPVCSGKAVPQRGGFLHRSWEAAAAVSEALGAFVTTLAMERWSRWTAQTSILARFESTSWIRRQAVSAVELPFSARLPWAHRGLDSNGSVRS